MLTIQQAQRLLRTGAISSEQLVLFCVTRAATISDAWERRIDTHTLLEQARQSDFRRAQNKLLSPLDGIPFSVKANLAVASLPLTAGSAILETNACVGYHAQVVDALLQSGAVLMGTTTMDEFGMGSLGINRPKSKTTTSRTKNPISGWHRHTKRFSDEEMIKMILHSPETINTRLQQDDESNVIFYSPGGSSSGSAVTVAQQAALFSLGSDTGGSVRLPAAWCAVAGLKPTYGCLSRDGLVAYASSLDTVGILAPTVSCLSVVWRELLQQQLRQPRQDSTLRPFQHNSIQTYSSASTRQKLLERVKVAVPTAFVIKEMSQPVRDNWKNAARRLEEMGATVDVIDTISPQVLQQALAAYYVLACAEATSNLGRYDGFRYGSTADCDRTNAVRDIDQPQSKFSLLEQQYAQTRTRGFGSEVIRRILCGTSVLSSDHYHTHYEAAAKLRAVLAQQMRDVLEQYDLLLVPTTFNMPPRIDEANSIDSTAMMANDIMTVPASLGGFPALSIPYGHWERAPFAMSMQLVAAQQDEQKLFRVAEALQDYAVD
ncbi:aspartyl-tRNA(Asn)/glutamyl-tRNA(Gln) amidotransferase subunit A [Fistulifera solaris]|uniref:Aspartyl-tRNA(Asn)/glutamyl-tRNA(Gln) amidotransferase subunit A n=1 Tax=Fistulifera solaris TaxID=1519565 RepID=A0A1Z5JMW4_FISSO|nr:aspartyl-tRNA(Asn)/glutamyl-tRNA(Gln) amidotransferase subunit A [Fistulifera solaris]|eukprot:GAX15353.1 aspartyl-tRNA(Asn)/glutamyl-tRNA(Gln) amidotransferase subunit A [Fistulifera solaris]